MMLKPLKQFAAAVTAGTLILAPFSTALANGMGSGYTPSHGGNFGGSSYGPDCNNKGGYGGKTVIFNKPINVYKPTTINKNINIYKPININKNININNNININKNIDNSKNININKNTNINKNININKSVNINKNIIINKGGGGSEAMASAFASAMASASANSSSSSVSYSGSYSDVTVINRGGGGGGAIVVGGGEEQGQCEMQEATIVKAIHAVCIAEGREFAASHMIRDTWIASGFEGEIARCIAGAHLKIVVGDVLQSDQGMAGTYASGSVLECGDHEALRHFKDGQLKCTPAEPVPDCTERTNLRKFGTGDFFFSYRGKVCVGVSRTASTHTTEEGIQQMEADGGVGASNGYDN